MLMKQLGLLALALTLQRTFGGPDHFELPFCHDLLQTIDADTYNALLDAVQALQSTESYVGQLRLGRSLPLPSDSKAAADVTTLEVWRNGNATKLQQLLEGNEVSRQLGGGTAAATTALARACFSTRLRPDAFTGRPLVSVLLEYFKRPAVVSRIASVLRSTCAEVGMPCELVVHVDNPHEAGAWAAEVAAGFVVPVFSANVHESRGYNRAAKLARGRYLVIWQDDQIPPRSGRWLTDMARLFAARPRLGVLGMHKYRLCRPREPNNRWGPTAWDPDPRVASAPGEGGVRWSFVQLVDFAPMAVRADLWRALGGLEEGWSRPGDCGISGDWELCVRAWLSGYQVGYMHLAGRRDDASAPGGTHTALSSEACWGRQGHVGRESLRIRYANDAFFGEMCERVWLLNTLSFTLPGPDKCPYDTYDTNWGNCSTHDAAAALRRAAALLPPQQLAQLPMSSAAPEPAPDPQPQQQQQRRRRRRLRRRR